MSSWSRWDMHIHTPETHMQDNFIDDKGSKTNKDEVWKRYCLEINEYGADVLGITDYFSASNYFKLQKNRNSWGLNQNIVLFPNVEIRVTDLASKKQVENGKTTSFVNLHLIFSPDIEERDLNKFLRELKATMSTGKKLNYVDDIDKIVHDNRVDYMPTTVGVLEALRAAFGDNYAESVLIMLPNSGDGPNLSDGNGSMNGKEFIQGSVNIIQAKTAQGEKDRKYLLSNSNRFGKVFPAITGCDAHRYEQLHDFPKTSFTWIKAERTFEGLKQITYEPDLRVKIQPNRPEAPVKSKIIKSIQLNNPSFGIDTLEFSESLNTIIGGRSSGKSVLLSLISKLASGVEHFKSNNSKYDELINKLSDRCILEYADGSTSSAEGRIKFIYQDGLQEIARDAKVRNNFIENTLSTLTDINAIKDENANYRRQKHDLIVKDVSHLKLLDQRISDQKAKIDSRQNVQTINGNIALLMQKERKVQAQLKIVDQLEVDKMLEKKRDLQVTARDAQDDIKELSQLSEVDIVQLNPQLRQYTRQVVKETVDSFDDKVAELNSALKENVDVLIQTKKQFVDKKNFEIEDVLATELYKQYQNQQKQSPELKKIQNILNDQRQLLTDTNSAITELKELKASKKNLLVQILEDLTFDEAIFSKKIYQTEDETLKFEIVSAVDAPKFSDLLSSTFKVHSVAFKSKIENIDSEDNNFNVDKLDSINSESIFKMMGRCLDVLPTASELPFRSGVSLYSWLEQFSDLDFITTNYKITYKNQDFSEMSEGKQAFILLMMQLSLDKDDKPFLIDQPEDELDNKAIYDELVSYLRQQKQHRQLFVVTHNANVLVGGDSECVTLASEVMGSKTSKGRKFQYRQGPIENPAMQTEICEVLEGGKRAFQKREERYAFSRGF